LTLLAAHWSCALNLRSNVLRNKAAQVLEAGRKDAIARGSTDVAPIFAALADSYERQARMSEQSRELLEMPRRKPESEPEAM
jgi:ABC-type phosphate transport system substrate-binding protein